jgi:type I restriction enzyme M protein
MTLTLNEILKDSAYKLTQLSAAQIQTLENSIMVKEERNKATPYVTCLARGKEIKLTPEEAVRQLYLMVLIQDFSYPVKRIAIEYGVTFGRETKRADICIFDKDRPTVPYILVELKKPKLKDGKDQLKSYCNATGAPIGVWTNGDSISWYQRKDPNYFEDIPRIPTALEKLSDVLSERWTIDDLVKYDKLVNEKKSLKDLILEMEDEVLANAGVDVFEELFKLIFTKLYDEMEGGRDKKRHLVFKNYGDTETELKTKIQELFDKARGKWDGVFTDDAKLQLTPSHLAVCVSSLEGVKLFNSNLDVVDEAFEYLINKSSKGEKGQYFTPRYVIDMCVKMLNPQEHETLIDTAAGSCGFPVHGIFHVWEQIMQQEGLSKSHLFTTEKKPARCETYVQDKVFAIDFDEKAVRVGRTLNLIAGDGQTNVLHLNTLDYERWDEKTKDEDWGDIYGEGWKKLRKLRVNKDSNRDFGFDVLMANPPFAGDIKETRILAKYELGKKDNGKYQSTVGRDILFIERNLNFLKPGGRMAVVLPQGRFNNSSDKQIREFIAEHARILAVVGLHGNVFKPHTGTKTSVLLVQKWDDILCPKVDDYPIFFATMQEPSKDNSGDKIYVKRQKVSTFEANDNKDGFKLVKYEQADFLKKYGSIKEATTYEFTLDSKQTRMNLEQIEFKFNGLEFVENPINLAMPIESNELLMDAHGHLIVKHDLFNHDGLTQDGIAEAFIEFAKKEHLSFFDCGLSGFKNLTGLYAEPFNEVKYRALLDRLEISALTLKEILKNNDLFRLEAEFFSKKYLELDKIFSGSPKLGDYAKQITCGPFGSNLLDTEYKKNGILVIRPFNLKNYKVEDENLVYIDENCLKTNGLKKFEKGTLLFSRVGDIKIGVLNKDNATISPNIIAVNFSDIDLTKYLCVFYFSKYGFKQIERQLKVSAQPTISTSIIAELKFPCVSRDLICAISFILDKSHDFLAKSKGCYTQAENLLLNALGIENFSPSTKNTTEKSFKDSFVATGRLDAEYYQPKYDELEAEIAKTNVLIKLKDLLTLNQRGTQPNYAEQGLPVINSKHVREGEVLLTDNRFATLSDKEQPLFIKKGDVLINGTGVGTIGRSACYLHEQNALPDNHVTILRTDSINPIFLSVYLNSIAGKYQVDKYFKGSSGQIELYPKDIDNFYIPLVNEETQTQIANLVQQSFTLKAESERLLDADKRAVEIAIETDEQTAMVYINEQTGEKSCTPKN